MALQSIGVTLGLRLLDFAWVSTFSASISVGRAPGSTLGSPSIGFVLALLWVALWLLPLRLLPGFSLHTPLNVDPLCRPLEFPVYYPLFTHLENPLLPPSVGQEGAYCHSHVLFSLVFPCSLFILPEFSFLVCFHGL